MHEVKLNVTFSYHNYT